MIDAHNHLQQFEDPQTIVSAMRAAGVTRCVVNGTREEDWNAVARLARDFPDFVQPAFGLHPWYAKHRSSSWRQQLQTLLEEHPHASLGECGVDSWMKKADLDDQIEVLAFHLALARERNLPITCHVLKAWPAFHAALQQEAPPARGLLLHSFGGSPEQAESWIEKGAYFSFSGYFLHEKKAKVLETYRAIPLHRILLETDGPSMTPPPTFQRHPLEDGRNHPANLPEIARGLATALDVPVETLIDHSDRNATEFFGLKDCRV